MQIGGAKSNSGKRMFGLDSVSSQGEDGNGSWKLGIMEKKLDQLDKKSLGISFGREKIK